MAPGTFLHHPNERTDTSWHALIARLTSIVSLEVPARIRATAEAGA